MCIKQCFMMLTQSVKAGKEEWLRTTSTIIQCQKRQNKNPGGRCAVMVSATAVMSA